MGVEMAVIPQDLVAIFHASFHPTQGNLVDWSLKASDDLNLDNIEFSVLPSGLHLIDRDVVYFTKDGQHGVCIFCRRKTQEQGQRGFRLSSLGVLLARSRRPRPWRHTAALKDLIRTIYNQCEEAGLVQPTESQWEPARAFFEERKVRRVNTSEWNGWSQDLSDPTEFSSHPTLHLSHLLRILGPSSLTIYRHVLGRQRILIYTQPPVEAACILCYAAADMCYEAQSSTPGRSREPLSVLGMVTLSDMRRLGNESGSGWIACTTDAIFLEKPSCYDLLLDLTHSGSRPAFYISKPVISPPPRRPTHRLSLTRFAWSDIKLWNELDRILQLGHHSSENDQPLASTITTRLGVAWADIWRVYEDVCVLCAGVWMGLGSWRPSTNPSAQGAIGLEGDDYLGVSGSENTTREGSYVRNLGMGIEGRPSGSTTTRAMRRSSAMSWSSGRATVIGGPGTDEFGGPKTQQGSSSRSEDNGDVDEEERADRQLCTTLALLQTLHAHAAFQLAVLASLLPPSGTASTDIVCLCPKDMVQFELAPLSSSDARYLEWLVQEYAGDTHVVIKRGWRDLVGALLSYT